MGLFSRKTEEEKEEIKNRKIEEKEDKKRTNSKFKELVKGARPYIITILQDSENEANGAITLYVHKDGCAYLSYTKIGSLKTTNDLTEYNVVDFEWLEDIKNKGKKVVGRAIVGNLLAGPAGMIIGGVTGKSKTKDRSTAVLSLQDIQTKKVRMFSLNCEQKDMKKYKMIPKAPLLETEESPVQNSNIDKSPAEQIKEYKELLDLDIITQEEFNAKKNELLNL